MSTASPTRLAEQDKTARDAGLRWKPVLLISFLFASSFFVRHLAGYAVSGTAYTPFVYSAAEIQAESHSKYDFRPDDTVWDEARAYARMTQGIRRGELLNATIETYKPYLMESGAAPKHWFIRDGIGQVALAGIASIPHSSVPLAFVIADFVFVFFCAIALMMFCSSVRTSFPFCMAGTAFVLFFNWRDLLNNIDFLHGAPQNSSMFLRTPYPQIAFPLVLLFIVSVIAFTQKPGYFQGLLVAITLALNGYTYFYSWTFAFSFATATAILVFAEERGGNTFTELDNKTQRTIGVLALSMGVALAASLPVWAGVLQKTAAVTDSFRRINGELTHAADIRNSLPLVILAAVVFVWKRRGRHVHWVALAVIIASLMVLNVQILTGKTIQPGHWTTYFIRPLLQICLLDVLWPFIENHQQLKRLFPPALAFGGVALTSVLFWVAAVQSAPVQKTTPSFEELVQVLKQSRLQSLGFVSNDVYLSTILPAYVRQKPLMPSYMDPISDVELSQLQLAASEAAGNHSWEEYARMSGTTSQPNQGVPRLHYRPESVLIVVNKHREFRPAVGKCEILDNADFKLLAPCPAR